MRRIGFLGIIGVLCLGCVEPAARPSESVLGALKAEVAALPKPPPLAFKPGQRRPDHQLSTYSRGRGHGMLWRFVEGVKRVCRGLGHGPGIHRRDGRGA